jgi:O-Glycosyl hydrolase family 30
MNVSIDATKQNTFQDWGTSLCWWAYKVGHFSKPSQEAIADLLFSPPPFGLGITCVRYNIGGGDDPCCKYGSHFRPGGDIPGWNRKLQTNSGSAPLLSGERFQCLDINGELELPDSQLLMLLAAKERGATTFEAFSNSPPFDVTVTGCSSGSNPGGSVNLDMDRVHQFTAYLVDTLKTIKINYGVDFQTLDPVNEPHPSRVQWGAGGNQEGCNFEVKNQAVVILSLSNALQKSQLITQVA